jgi:hypothetical protein
MNVVSQPSHPSPQLEQLHQCFLWWVVEEAAGSQEKGPAEFAN